VTLESLSEIVDHVGHRVNVDGLVIVSIDGDLYDRAVPASITVRDGEIDGRIVIPAGL
jgi:hypothetical protein